MTQHRKCARQHVLSVCLQVAPAIVVKALSGFETDAQRAIQFTRSTPGIDVALVGMSKVAHVSENLGVAHVPPVALGEYMQLFRQ